MNPNCLYAEPRDWTQVAAGLGEANDAGFVNILQRFYLNCTPAWAKKVFVPKKHSDTYDFAVH